GLRHRRAGPGGDDAPALHLPPFDRGSGQIEADVRALLALLGSDQDTVADDDQAFGVIRHTEMSSPVWAFCASRRARVMPVTQPLLDLSGPVYNNVPAAIRPPSYPVGGLFRCKRLSPTPRRPSNGVSCCSSSCSGWLLGWRGSSPFKRRSLDSCSGATPSGVSPGCPSCCCCLPRRSSQGAGAPWYLAIRSPSAWGAR